ncbi:MAG TPA: TIGR01777 family oxidoreductase [Ignavibacteriales bacterium]|nr:TIGR01777 family oxidoreductase [Ignavibacteriales bacterium]HOL82035.1 TIGR01777 family oxidoreductase [Ignavibacteriales bacterium]HPD67697.1 TIGR01777 family oxidoreductase [Ignavibacteriales bacterium]HPP34170.1 TIGR01777 family oxidoreductase [Ignavibacteriales bacterium]
MRIFIIGATGLIGRHLVENLKEKHQIFVVTRDTNKAKEIFGESISVIHWDYKSLCPTFTSSLAFADGIINLAGANIGKRWTKHYKKVILESRAETTKYLVENMLNSGKKFEFFINTSAVGYYGSSLSDKIYDENSMPGDDFLAKVCIEWENYANMAKEITNKFVITRFGVVFAKKGSALQKMLLPFKLFMGGEIATGKQWLSWIHIDDLLNIFDLIIDTGKLNSVVNLVSPNPVQNNEFTSIVSKVLNRPSFIRMPEFALKLLLGDGAMILTKGQRVYPKCLTEINYEYKYSDISQVIKSVS